MNPDEKICPFCLETIKAGALRCRYCHADLTGAAPATSVSPVVAAPGIPAAPVSPPSALFSPVPVASWQVLDLLATLVDKNLVVYEEDEAGRGRYRLLETVRQYARERLRESGEGEAVRTRHGYFVLALTAEAAPHLGGPAVRLWMERLERERENGRAALEWLLNTDAEVALRIASNLGQFWTVRGPVAEGLDWLRQALDKTPGQRTAIRARALNEASRLTSDRAPEQARALAEEAVALWRVLDDRSGLAGSLEGLGWAYRELGDKKGAKALFQESLAIRRELGDEHRIGVALMALGALELWENHDDERAEPLLAESVRIRRKAGEKWGLAWSLYNLGMVYWRRGDTERAYAVWTEGLALRREMGDKLSAYCLLDLLSKLEYARGNYAQARLLSEERVANAREMGEQEEIANALGNLADVEAQQGNYTVARALQVETLHLRCDAGNPLLIGWSLQGFAVIATVQRQIPGLARRAARLWGAAERVGETIGDLSPDSLAFISGSLAYTQDIAAARTALAEEVFAHAWAEGRAMTLEQAVAYALAEPDVTAL